MKCYDAASLNLYISKEQHLNKIIYRMLNYGIHTYMQLVIIQKTFLIPYSMWLSDVLWGFPSRLQL